jgi:hypothetical protein
MARTAFHGRLDLLLRVSQAQAAATQDTALVSLVSKASGQQLKFLNEAITKRIAVVTTGPLDPTVSPRPPSNLSLRAHFILNRLAQVRTVLLDKRGVKGADLVADLVAGLGALKNEESTGACLDYLTDYDNVLAQFNAVFDSRVFETLKGQNLGAEALRQAIGERLKALAALEADVTEHVQGDLRLSRAATQLETKAGSKKAP